MEEGRGWREEEETEVTEESGRRSRADSNRLIYGSDWLEVMIYNV